MLLDFPVVVFPELSLHFELQSRLVFVKPWSVGRYPLTQDVTRLFHKLISSGSFSEFGV